MMIPTIHLNGTGKRELLNELDEAVHAVAAALKAVGNITVHGRDYYPQGPHAYEAARREQDARLRRLREVEDELVEIHIKLAMGVK